MKTAFPGLIQFLTAAAVSVAVTGCGESRVHRQARERNENLQRNRAEFFAKHRDAEKFPRDEDDQRSPLTILIQNEIAAHPEAQHWIETNEFDLYREKNAILLSINDGDNWLKLEVSPAQSAQILASPRVGTWDAPFLFLFTISGVSPLRLEMAAESQGEGATLTANEVMGRLYTGRLEEVVALDQPAH